MASGHSGDTCVDVLRRVTVGGRRSSTHHSGVPCSAAGTRWASGPWPCRLLPPRGQPCWAGGPVALASRRAEPAGDAVRDAVPVRAGVDRRPRASHSPSRTRSTGTGPPTEGKPVVAAAAGVVVDRQASGTRGYGRYVVVDHGNGETHALRPPPTVVVRLGQTVDQGALLGTVGEHRQRHRPAPALRGAAGRQVVPPCFHGAAFGSTHAWRRRTAPTSRWPATSSATGSPRSAVFGAAQRRRSGQPPGGAASVVAFGGRHRPAGAGRLGRRRARRPRRAAPRRRTSSSSNARPASVSIRVSGNRSDLPVAGDWDGDGTWEIGVRTALGSHVSCCGRPRRHRRPRCWLGNADDLPVTGDWDGDGITDLGVYDLARPPSRCASSTPRARLATRVVQFGTPGDLPVTGDWDGDGRRPTSASGDPGTATFTQRVGPPRPPRPARLRHVRFGNAASLTRAADQPAQARGAPGQVRGAVLRVGQREREPAWSRRPGAERDRAGQQHRLLERHLDA